MLNFCKSKQVKRICQHECQEPDTATMMGNKDTVLGVGAWQKVPRARNK